MLFYIGWGLNWSLCAYIHTYIRSSRSTPSHHHLPHHQKVTQLHSAPLISCAEQYITRGQKGGRKKRKMRGEKENGKKTFEILRLHGIALLLYHPSFWCLCWPPLAIHQHSACTHKVIIITYYYFIILFIM